MEQPVISLKTDEKSDQEHNFDTESKASVSDVSQAGNKKKSPSNIPRAKNPNKLNLNNASKPLANSTGQSSSKNLKNSTTKKKQENSAEGPISKTKPSTTPRWNSRSNKSDIQSGSKTTRPTISSTNFKTKSQTNLQKVTSTAGDQITLEAHEKELIKVQTEFMNRFEAFTQSSPDNQQLKGKHYKLISLVQNGKPQILVDESLREKWSIVLSDNSKNEFKEKIKKYMDEEFATFKNKLKENPTEDQQEIQDSNTKAIFDLIDALCESYKYDDNNIEKLHNELKEYKKSLKEAEENLAELTKKHEDEILSLKTNLESESIMLIAQKDNQISELEKNLQLAVEEARTHQANLKAKEKEFTIDIENLQEELDTNRESYKLLEKNFKILEVDLKTQSNEVYEKNETIANLQNELQALKIRMKEMTLKYEKENKSPELLKEISNLQESLKILQHNNMALEKENQKLQESLSLKKDLEGKLQQAETQIINLQQQLSEYPENVQHELSKLRQSVTEKRREIEKLKSELSKSQINITQLEEQIKREHQLLEVRSELINSLQENEKNHNIQMGDLLAQIGERNTTINELTTEVRIKTEDFQNLCDKINSKQEELSNQAHVIKLLEENNNRNQMLRIKQEEKIGRMEDDINQLKQTIAIYQANLLNCNMNLILPAAIAYHNHHDGGDDGVNHNLQHFINERKRKRHIDINVKKYET
ncbi:salto isoform X2 [Haematobia irritans]|uniref:salto isoform X2 n=1 Tax=Haematobia irritans TaxID=7368 RepID=UPI003F501D06